MFVNFRMLIDRQKRMSDYLSAAPADGIFSAHSARTEISALPSPGQLCTKYIVLLADEVTLSLLIDSSYLSRVDECRSSSNLFFAGDSEKS